MTQTRIVASRKVIALLSIFAGAALLLLPFSPAEGVPLLFLFVGRFHPLLLHFPIVLSIIALLVEIARRFFLRRIPLLVTEVLLGAATLSAWVTIAAGYFLYASGEYSGEVILQHFWAGTLAGTGLSVALGMLMYYHTTQRLYGAFLATLLLTNAAVAYASHLGGTVTHGQEYLVEYLHMMQASGSEVSRPEQEQLLYADMVAPVLEARCVSCHNEQRAKGGLALDGYSKLFGAGDSQRPAVVRSSLAKSEAISRIRLPLEDDEHMPPAGKSPMTPDEVALLTFWIENGASDTSRVWTARGNDSVRTVIDRLAPELRKYQLRMAVSRSKETQAVEMLNKLAPTLGLQVQPDSTAEGNSLQLTAAVPPSLITGEHMRKLAPYFPYFSKVSLVSSGVEDDMLYYLAQMTSVQALYLQKNAIDGSGLVYLTKIPELEVLNLSFTRVDDRYALELLKFPKLRKVYLYRTNVSPDVIAAIKRYRPGLEILEEEGPYF